MNKNVSDVATGDVLTAHHFAMANKWDEAFEQYVGAGKHAEEKFQVKIELVKKDVQCLLFSF